MDYVAVGIVAGIVAAVLVCLGLLCCVCKTLRPSSAEGFGDIEKLSPTKKDYPTMKTVTQVRHKRKGSSSNQHRPTIVSNGKMYEDQLPVFALETLKKATGNFSHSKKLGEGGFGLVYEGTLTEGKQIAVKKLSLKSKQGKEQFRNEAKVLARVKHKNLVEIIGCCAEGDERLLVYEYLPNKSLDKFLFDPQRIKELDWGKRFSIIRGIASGLAYLHDGSPERIVHRDIKAANILLDKNMKPKIADFGLARMFIEDETHVCTGVLAGTCGYIAPEYFSKGEISPRADVYSFGVLLLEIVCGRKNNDQNLTKQVWRSFKRKQSVDVIDSKIIEEFKKEAENCIHVGLLCIQRNASLRPIMSKVQSLLSDSSTTKMEHPTKPAFFSITEDEMRSRTQTGFSTISLKTKSAVSKKVVAYPQMK